MSTETEIAESVDLLKASGTAYALLHCQSTYPAPFKDVNLRYLTRLAELGGCPVGYSGHERGFHVPLAAVGLGASDHREALDRPTRPWRATTTGSSLLPGEFADMVARGPRARGGPRARPRRGPCPPGELMNRVNLAKSLVAARPVSAGEVITAPTPSTSRAPVAASSPTPCRSLRRSHG